MSAVLAVWLLAGVTGCGGPDPASVPAAVEASPDYLQEIEQWRAERLARLQSETGYLSLVGLHWLAPGENRFGSAADNAIVLPEGAAPEHAGTLVLEGRTVHLRAAPGAAITLDGQPVVERDLRTDIEGNPDVLRLGRLYVHVIERGERLGLRVKDPESPARREFHGIEHFPVDPSYHWVLPLHRYAEPRPYGVPDVLGMTQHYLAAGTVTFEHGGQTGTLVGVIEPGEPDLFFVFGDLTNGKETYGGGRFLYAPVDENDQVDLDFNRAYDPPCAFTPYATCPLPPEDNRLAMRIEAGEKRYAGH